MRGKRAKQYKKLMKQYEITYGFREPYQVLSKFWRKVFFVEEFIMLIAFTVDAEMVKETDRFKMDLVEGLKRTLHGEVKPSIYLQTNSFQIDCLQYYSDYTMLYAPSLCLVRHRRQKCVFHN